MDKKKLFITVIIGSMIFLLAMGVMFSGSKNVSAVDYEKVYNDDLKEVVIKDKGIEVATIKLLTPLDNHVGLGYQRVAEYKVNSIIALESLTSTIETYNINDKMKEISRNIDYKIKTIEEIIVNDYETICENNNIGDKKINISENETCEQILVGNHTEERVVWNDLNKIKFDKDESIIIGLYTIVEKGDKIEWIPTFEIDKVGEIRVEEWAVWTGDLNTGLKFYLKLDETSGTVAVDSTNTYNFTNTGITNINQAGLIGKSYKFIGATGDYLSNTSYSNVQGEDFAWNFWVKNATGSAGTARVIGVNAAGYQTYITVSTNQVQGCFNTVDNTGGCHTVTSYDPSFSSDVWHMVTFNVLYNASGLVIETYTDGVLRETDISAKTITAQGDFYFGHLPNEGQAFTGYLDEVSAWNRSLTSTEVTQLYNSGDGITWIDFIDCEFSGYVFDENSNAIENANVTIWNQYNVSEYYETNSSSTGYWAYNVSNSTNTYMVGAYYNNTLIGQLKPFISGAC